MSLAICSDQAELLWANSDVKYAQPEHSREEVDRAGDVIIGPMPEFNEDGNVSEENFASLDEWSKAYDILNNWRSSHSFPLNTFQTTLRKRAGQTDANCLLAQRIKAHHRHVAGGEGDEKQNADPEGSLRDGEAKGCARPARESPQLRSDSCRASTSCHL
jgi:hypothetical protein